MYFHSAYGNEVGVFLRYASVSRSHCPQAVKELTSMLFHVLKSFLLLSRDYRSSL